MELKDRRLESLRRKAAFTIGVLTTLFVVGIALVAWMWQFIYNPFVVAAILVDGAVAVIVIFGVVYELFGFLAVLHGFEVKDNEPAGTSD